MGGKESVSLSEGRLQVDQSNLTFSAQAKAFSMPDVAFRIDVDAIDIDRYLPPPSPGGETPSKLPSDPEKPSRAETDYGPLRTLVLDGILMAGKVTVKGTRVENISLNVTASSGLVSVKALTADLYEGNVNVKGSIDVRKGRPRSEASVRAKGIQVGPLLQDLLEKDLLEGLTSADIHMTMSGDTPDAIKKTLNGKGNLLFNDGAIKGVDLAGMVRNAKATFGLAEKGTEKPRTDFAELRIPFTISRGVVNTPDSGLLSPLLRVKAAGTADLVKETIDFRVEPKFVATIAGQGDTQQRSGLSVPILIDGTFSAPKFRPDLGGMVKQNLTDQLPQLQDITKGLQREGASKDDAKPLEEAAKGLLKGLPFGR